MADRLRSRGPGCMVSGVGSGVSTSTQGLRFEPANPMHRLVVTASRLDEVTSRMGIFTLAAGVKEQLRPTFFIYLSHLPERFEIMLHMTINEHHAGVVGNASCSVAKCIEN